MDCLFVIAALEHRKAHVEPQARQPRLKRQRFAIRRDRLGIVLLPRLEQAQMRLGFRIPGILLSQRAPRRLRLNVLSLPFEREGCRARIVLRRRTRSRK
jgi:hypothetical protein